MHNSDYLRIAIYSGQVPGTTFIERLVSGLAQRGHTILLFGNKVRDVDYPANVQVYPVPEGKWNTAAYILKNFVRLLFVQPSYLKLALGLISSRKADKARYAAKILPVLLHKPDIFHIQWAKSIADWAWVQDIGIKLVVSLRGSHITYSPVASEQLAGIYRQRFPAVDAFHAVSDAVGKLAATYGAHNIRTIYSGLAPEVLKYSGRQQKTGTSFNIISIGRWHWVKGFNYAIDAMWILAGKGFDFHYTIIGGAATEEALYHIKSLGLDSYITVIKELPNDEVMKRMQDADLLLLPSISEGVANVVLEAMSIGTLVLSTECGGMNEVLSDGVNGFLVPVRDSIAIAEKVWHIKDLAAERKEQIRLNARKTIEAQHDISGMIDEFERLYRSVIN